MERSGQFESRAHSQEDRAAPGMWGGGRREGRGPEQLFVSGLGEGRPQGKHGIGVTGKRGLTWTAMNNLFSHLQRLQGAPVCGKGGGSPEEFMTLLSWKKDISQPRRRNSPWGLKPAVDPRFQGALGLEVDCSLSQSEQGIL